MNAHKKPDIRLGHIAAIYALAADPQNPAIFTGDGAGHLVRWWTDTPDGMLIAQGESPWYTCAFLPEEALIVAGNLAGQLWWIDPVQLAVTHRTDAHPKGVYFCSPFTGGMLSGGADGVLHIWQGTEKQASAKLSHAALRGIATSADGATIAIAASDSNIYLLDNQSFGVIKVLAAAHVPSVFTVCFSACGRFLFSGGRDAHLCIWDVQNDYQLLHRIPAHYYTINDICLDPTANRFYTASRDRTIKCWDANTFELLSVFDAAKYSVHTASVNRVVCVGQKVWSVSDDKRLVGWEK
jgi:WD40 repeat protein